MAIQYYWSRTTCYNDPGCHWCRYSCDSMVRWHQTSGKGHWKMFSMPGWFRSKAISPCFEMCSCISSRMCGSVALWNTQFMSCVPWYSCGRMSFLMKSCYLSLSLFFFVVYIYISLWWMLSTSLTSPSIEFHIYIDTRIYQIYLFFLFLAVCIQRKTWDDIAYDEISDVESQLMHVCHIGWCNHVRGTVQQERSVSFGGCRTGSTKMASRDIYKQMHRLWVNWWIGGFCVRYMWWWEDGWMEGTMSRKKIGRVGNRIKRKGGCYGSALPCFFIFLTAFVSL